MNSIFNNKDVFLLNKKIPITPKGISQERSFLLSLYRHLNAIEKETEFKKILNIWTSEDHEAVQKNSWKSGITNKMNMLYTGHKNSFHLVLEHYLSL